MRSVYSVVLTKVICAVFYYFSSLHHVLNRVSAFVSPKILARAGHGRPGENFYTNTLIITENLDAVTHTVCVHVGGPKNLGTLGFHPFGTECGSRERMFQGTFVPWTFRHLEILGTNGLENERSRERKFHHGQSHPTCLYNLCGHVLSSVQIAKYLGITLTDELSWSSHVHSIHSRANSTLGFVRRNLRHSPAKLKETAYITLVRSTLEYAASIWNPHLAKDCDLLEKLQRRSARFVKGDYRTT